VWALPAMTRIRVKTIWQREETLMKNDAINNIQKKQSIIPFNGIVMRISGNWSR